MLVVAIASENAAYDGVVFERLLSVVLARPVQQWKTALRIIGCKQVVGLAEPFLHLAAKAEVQHALFAIDNDGGARRGPEHETEHDRAVHAADEDGCRTCRVMEAIPSWWTEGDRRHCVAVPVQALETWLLWVRGDSFVGEPEKDYHRAILKRRFFGKPLPPEQRRAQLALEPIAQPDALARLRQRRSFRFFEEQLAPWR
jgi:hypothetical protein